MTSALSLVLIVLVGSMLLLPPLAFARAVYRHHNLSLASAGGGAHNFWTLAAFVPMLLNIVYMASAWPELSAGILEPDQNMAIAVLISWFAFWGRVALGRRIARCRSHMT